MTPPYADAYCNIPKTRIIETSPHWHGSLRKNILYNCFKNLVLFVEK